MEIQNPKRILLLSHSSTTISPIISTLTRPPSKVQDPEEPGGQADLIHEIKTPYYAARIPIWTDTVVSAEEWSREWKAMGEAGDVVKAVGAWVVGFEKPVGGDDLVGFAVERLWIRGF